MFDGPRGPHVLVLVALPPASCAKCLLPILASPPSPLSHFLVLPSSFLPPGLCLCHALCFPGWLHIIHIFSQISWERHFWATVPRTAPLSLAYLIPSFLSALAAFHYDNLHVFICWLGSHQPPPLPGSKHHENKNVLSQYYSPLCPLCLALCLAHSRCSSIITGCWVLATELLSIKAAVRMLIGCLHDCSSCFIHIHTAYLPWKCILLCL